MFSITNLPSFIRGEWRALTNPFPHVCEFWQHDKFGQVSIEGIHQPFYAWQGTCAISFRADGHHFLQTESLYIFTRSAYKLT